MTTSSAAPMIDRRAQPAA